MTFNRLNVNQSAGSFLVVFLLTIISTILLMTKSSANERSLETTQNLKIMNAVMPAVPPVSRTAAIYLSIQNSSDQAIVIDSVETDIARHAMFHQTIESNGIAKMQHHDQLVIPAKQSLDLLPGGTHIMLMGLKEIPEKKQFLLYLGSANNRYKVLVEIVERNKE